MERHHLISREAFPRALALQYFQKLIDAAAALPITIDWVEEATITLSLSDCAEDLASFAGKRGVQVSNPESILEALFSLEGLRASLNWTSTDLVNFLADEAKKTKPAQDIETSKIVESLNRFFAVSDKLERTRKAQRVYDGLLPRYDACSSLVEFRPVFDEARQKIVNGIIAATLTIEMSSEEFEEKKVSVQLDAADIDQLLAELARLKAKLKLLRKLAESNTVLLNPTRSLNVDK